MTVQNPCLSGGSLEIFLEPVLASPRVLVVGETPIAGAVARMGGELDLDLVVEAGADVGRRADDLGAGRRGARARRAQRAAARARGGPALRRPGGQPRARLGVVAELRAEGLTEERLAALETPAGLDIGARTPAEIALSILARIVAVRRGEQTLSVRLVAPAGTGDPSRAADGDRSRCGMVVAAVAQTPHVDHEGRRVYFCCDGCRSTWTRSHVPQ